MHTLSFILNVQEVVSESESGGRSGLPADEPWMFLKVNVVPVVDGISLSPLVFDAMSAIGQETTEGGADLFSCGCGSPDCGGLQDPVHLSFRAGAVHWTFPEEPYRRALDESLRNAGEPLVLSFDHKAYTEALQTLAGDLLDLESDSGMAVAVTPYPWACGPREPLALRFVDGRSTVLYWKEFNDRRAMLYGTLVNEELVVPLLYDVTLGISPVLIAQLRAEQLLGGDLDSEDFEEAQLQLLETNIIPAFRADPGAVIAAAKELDWATVEEAAYPVAEPSSLDGSADWRSLPLAVLQLAWNSAPMHLRTLPQSER